MFTSSLLSIGCRVYSQLMKNELKQEHYWHALRAQMGNLGKGNGVCRKWCTNALTNNDVASTFYLMRAEIEDHQVGSHVISIVHFWLERDSFIADGTAGQYDNDFPIGYYGYKHQASTILQEIYALGVSLY